MWRISPFQVSAGRSFGSSSLPFSSNTTLTVFLPVSALSRTARFTSCHVSTFSPFTVLIRCPGRTPSWYSSDCCPTYPTTGSSTTLGIPRIQRPIAITSAKTTFMNGPAKATRILESGETGGSGSSGSFSPPPSSLSSSSAFPSIASLVSICGNFTKPPAGMARIEYRMPSFSLLQTTGPKPMANSSTFRPRLSATQKWPNS